MTTRSTIPNIGASDPAEDQSRPQEEEQSQPAKATMTTRSTIPNIGASDPREEQGTARPIPQVSASDPREEQTSTQRSERVASRVPTSQRRREPAELEIVRQDFVGPLQRNQRRETDQELRDRRDAEFLEDRRRDRLAELARVLPSGSVRTEIIRKIQEGEPLSDAERELFLDGLELRAENLRRVQELVDERQRIEALTDIITGTAEVAIAVVPVKVPGAGKALRLAEHPLTRREARRLATQFLNREKFQAKEFVRRQAVDEALKIINKGRATSQALERSAARRAIRDRAAKQAQSAATRKARAAAARRAQAQSAQVRARAKALREKADEKALARKIEQQPEIVRRQSDVLKTPKRQLQRERGTIDKRLVKLRRQSKRATSPRRKAAIQETVDRLTLRRAAISTALTLGAAGAVAVAARSQSKQSPSAAGLPAGRQQPATAGGPSPAAEPATSPALSSSTRVTPGGGPKSATPPGPPPPSGKSPKPPGGGGGGGGGRGRPPRGRKQEEPKQTVRLKIPAGENPSKIGLRTGIVERVENLLTEETTFGRDLSAEVPNDPRIKPRNSIRILATTKRRVRYPVTRKIGNRRLVLSKINPTTVEVGFTSGKKSRRAKRPKLVKSRRDR